MPSITLSKQEKQSKGRNGWFNPVRIHVSHFGGIAMPKTVSIEVWSKREDGNPPIDLYLLEEDANKLGEALIADALANYQTSVRASLLSCELIRRIARMTKAGECANCGGKEDTCTCDADDAAPYVAFPEDTYDTMASLIDEARAIIAGESPIKVVLRRACPVCHEAGGNPYCVGCGKAVAS